MRLIRQLCGWSMVSGWVGGLVRWLDDEGECGYQGAFTTGYPRKPLASPVKPHGVACCCCGPWPLKRVEPELVLHEFIISHDCKVHIYSAKWLYGKAPVHPKANVTPPATVCLFSQASLSHRLSASPFVCFTYFYALLSMVINWVRFNQALFIISWSILQKLNAWLLIKAA